MSSLRIKTSTDKSGQARQESCHEEDGAASFAHSPLHQQDNTLCEETACAGQQKNCGASEAENGVVRRASVTFSQASPEEIVSTRREDDDDDDIFYRDDAGGFNSRTMRHPSSRQRMEDYRRSSSQRQSFKSDDMVSSWKDVLPYAYYIAMYSVMGAVLRVYMGRFFGLDCEYPVDDILTPLSSRICVTSTGTTEQTGGALFIDLPANMLGAWVIGIMSLNPEGLPLPWFQPDHPLQDHGALQAGLSVGFCGSLTTFASWNTQMVVMLDGTETVLGPQVAPALFGYLIGLACAVASFVCGRHVGGWLKAFRHHGRHRCRRPVSPKEDSISEIGQSWTDEDAGVKERTYFCRIWHYVSAVIRLPLSPFLVAAGLATAFAVADAKDSDLFYRKMWMTTALAPFGALLRWYLSDLNFRKVRGDRLGWVPWGTLSANLLASMVSVSAEAVNSHVFKDKADNKIQWLSPLMNAVKLGFAGCLSTVSTMLRELFLMDSTAKAHAYCSVSIVCAMLFSLTIYAPWVR